MSHQVDPLAVTRALAGDPAIAVRCALPALVQAWCAAAECSADDVAARVRAGAVDGVVGAGAERAAAILELAVAANRAEPWESAEVPRRRQVRACIRTLERATSRVHRWPAVAMAVVVAVGGFAMHALAARGGESPGTWTSTPFADASFSTPGVATRVTDLRGSTPSQRFHTCLELARPVDAAFQLVVGGGAALYVDGAPVVIDWTGLPGPRTRGARISLAAGIHRLRVDLYAPDADSGARVLASLDGGPPRALHGVAPCAESAP